jgi:hypothetical protein
MLFGGAQASVERSAAPWLAVLPCCHDGDCPPYSARHSPKPPERAMDIGGAPSYG